MKKTFKNLAPALLVAAVVAFGSASAQVPGADAIVGSLNSKLAEYDVRGFVNWWHVPGRFSGGKFVGGEVKINGKRIKLKAWVKDVLPIISGIADKVPSGYVLQVTGHANKGHGSESALRALSAKRAKYVHNIFKSLGLTTDKVTSKGVGTSEAGSGDNRRVTFKVVAQ